MDGVLTKKDGVWVVRYLQASTPDGTKYWEELPLYSEHAMYIDTYLDNYHDDVYLHPAYYNGMPIEFEIEDYWETGMEEVVRVAKLITSKN